MIAAVFRSRHFFRAKKDGCIKVIMNRKQWLAF
jgi:hypothetical protein